MNTLAYTALYREWRPKSFEDVVGQEHITTTLKNQILNDRIAHAYLFCGTRGTGKTSTAKVFAKALNCLNPQEGEPCNECSMCIKISEGLALDVSELDAASNNKVEHIREIIDEVKYPPQEGKYKVYILDEAHMLTGNAVNAFLKTLEEPPDNVIFILATTDPQKLPITILSRCQRFDFKRINQNQIINRLRTIVTKQGALVDDKSLALIARVSDGAMRDSLSILDQAIAMGDGKVEYEDLISMLGLVTNEHLFSLTNAIIQRNIEKSMSIIDEIVFAGKDIYMFIKELTTHYRNLLMVKVTNNPDEVLDMAEENIKLIKEQGTRVRAEEVMRCIRILQEAENNAKLSKQARIYLELAAIKMCKIEYDTSNEVILTRINRLEEGLKNGSVKVSVGAASAQGNVPGTQGQQQRPAQPKPQSRVQNLVGNKDSKVTVSDVQKAWKDMLERIKAKRAMIVFASLVTGKVVDCREGIVVIEYDEQFKFNKDRLEKPENRQIVQDVLAEIFREDLKVNYVIQEQEGNGQSTEDMLLQSIGSEFLEVLDE